jgi:hypothetical protein
MTSTFKGLDQFDQGFIIETTLADPYSNGHPLSNVQIYVTLDEDNYLHTNFTRYPREEKVIHQVGLKYEDLDPFISQPCHDTLTHKLNNTLEQVLVIGDREMVRFWRDNDSDTNIHLKIVDQPEELKYQPTKLQQWKLKNPDTKYVCTEIQLNGSGKKEPFYLKVPWIYNNGRYIETEPPYTTLMYPQKKSSEFWALYGRYKSSFPFCCY